MNALASRQLLVTAILGVALCAGLTACSRGSSYSANGVTVNSNGNKNNAKVTQGNADRIKQGQSEADVNGVLGSPAFTSTSSAQGKSVKLGIWQNGNNHITVTFLEGKVQASTTHFE